MSVSLNISKENFVREFQEKKPLLIKGAASIGGFTWDDVNDILDRSKIESNDFKLAYEGIRPKSDYVESYWDVGTLRHRLIKPAVYDYLKKGATLIANKIVNEPKINQYARHIEEFTGRQIVSSAYVAFGERDSFRSHWDTRDVFAIQLIGRKRWVIHEPSLALPLYTQQSKDYEHLYPRPESVYMEFILEPGDVFYLPRGWWHNPLPVGEATFHIAVGTFPVFTMDYLTWAMKLMPSYLGSRKSLVDWSLDQQNLADVGRYFFEFINSPENYARFMDEFVGATRVQSPLAIELFGDPSCQGLPMDTCLRLSATHPRGLDSQYLIANGTRLNLDNTGARLIACIAASPGIRLCEVIGRLSDLDSDKLRSLIRQLCHQDVLELARH